MAKMMMEDRPIIRIGTRITKGLTLGPGVVMMSTTSIRSPPMVTREVVQEPIGVCTVRNRDRSVVRSRTPVRFLFFFLSSAVLVN